MIHTLLTVLYLNTLRHNPLGRIGSKGFGFRGYLPLRGRSPLYNGQPYPVAWKPDQPEKRDGARSEWPDVGDPQPLVDQDQEQGSDELPDQERRPQQGAVGYAEECSRESRVLDSPAVKRAVRHALRKT